MNIRQRIALAILSRPKVRLFVVRHICCAPEPTDSRIKLLCSLRRGHAGDHEAHTYDKLVARWPQ